MKICYALLCLWMVNAYSATWEELRPKYMPMLDFRVSKKDLKEIPKFEQALNEVTKAEEASLIHPEADRERVGLVFIYDALMIINNNKGIKERILPHFDTRSLKERAQYALDLMIKAKTLRPMDRRLDSWISGARQALLSLDAEVVTDEALQEAIAAIPLRPTFNLWTAMLLFRTQDSSTELYGQLITHAKKFVDDLQTNDPCKVRPEDCGNGGKAPYNIQASLIILGDTFLRRGEFFLKKNDRSHAMEMLGYSKGTYEQLFAPDKLPGTSTWPDKEIIQTRLDYVGKLFNQRRLLTRTLNQQAQYARAYECASCHGRK